LTIEKKTKDFKIKPLDSDDLPFGQIKSDHMLEVDWTEEEGWGAPRIVPYHKFEIDPANATLQ
jgi:branched-chain amino acid aminotransferase